MAHVFGGGKHHHEEKKGEGASERTGVGTKEGTWWVGCREDMYIGLYCNEATVEDRSSRSDSQMQVSSTLLLYSPSLFFSFLLQFFRDDPVHNIPVSPPPSFSLPTASLSHTISAEEVLAPEGLLGGGCW
jgi:hypothetical protein